MHNQKLNGMTAVITGGNGVIGGVFARALAGEGADIAIICRNTGSAEGVMKDIRALGREAAVFQGDVLSREDMLRCREEILTRFGHINMLHINMLVNCAGGALKGAAVPQDQYSEDSKEEGNFFTTASEKIHQEFDLNIYGTILPTLRHDSADADFRGSPDRTGEREYYQCFQYGCLPSDDKNSRVCRGEGCRYELYGVGGNLFREKRCQGERSRAGVLPDAAES